MLICLSFLILWALDEGEAESIILLIFVLSGCFNYCCLKSDGVGQKVLFRTSWNRIFSLLIRLKSWSARGVPCHPASRKRGEVSPLFSFVRELENSPTDLPQARWRNLVCVEFRWLGFCSIGGWCYSGRWVWNLSRFEQFHGSEIRT